MRRMRACQAVILAAGRGTRMRSARPKVLQPISGLPMLEHVVRAVSATGATPVTVVVGPDGREVEEAFGGRGLTFLTQDPPLGTGDALKVASPTFLGHLDRPVLVVNGDLPLLRAETLAALLAQHGEGSGGACLLTARPSDPGAYGRIIRDAGGRITRIVEAKDASPEERAVQEVNAGAYVFDVAPLGKALGELQRDNAQAEYYLTDLVALLVSGGVNVGGLELGDPTEAIGVNTLEELATAAALLRKRRNSALLAQGVLIEDPLTTHVGPDCEIEPDARIAAFTFLEGRTRIRKGAEIGPFVRLISVEVGAGARILDHSVLREAVVEEGAAVGPFAHVRPESRIGAGAQVGNFVELKKTTLGKGSKAQHLSYLGDSTIGEKVNIGAGTITCNYDGTHKHPTHIEDGAFVGSDSTLVAPVSVGAGAYVAAGSTITEDVPKGALALGRARQVIKRNWVRKDRK
jgi:bifunctional UDP-N-acetylglucosamine pyrophosphorylase/glucosamine-1-phosphate N-acetyltransferase